MGIRGQEKSTGDQKRVCPFRINLNIKHALYTGTTEPVIASEEYVFADCYKEACPFWTWEVNRGYFCKKIGGERE